MTKIQWAARLAAGFLGVLALTVTAEAQAIRFVSTLGSDSGACTLTAPCETLKRGVNMTPVGGVLQVLDSGFYGPAPTIQKSITIEGNGNTVMLDSSGASRDALAIINNAGAIVTFKHLVLKGSPLTGFGVHIVSAAAVHIDGCTIQDFASGGIYSESNADLIITNSQILNNGMRGINVPGAGAPHVAIDHSRVSGHGGVGIQIEFGESTISNSVISGNDFGVVVFWGGITVTSSTVEHNLNLGIRAGGFSELTLENSAVSHNGFGVVATADSGVSISGSVVTNNTTGIQNDGAVASRGNNTVAGNGSDVSNPPLASLPPL